jgi:hypothetical protein
MNQLNQQKLRTHPANLIRYGVSVDLLPDDVDALRTLVTRLSSKRDGGGQGRRLTAQNDNQHDLWKEV